MNLDQAVTITVKASRYAGLELAALRQASGAFQGYCPGGRWVTADGRPLVAERISDVTPADRLVSGEVINWEATFRVGTEGAD